MTPIDLNLKRGTTMPTIVIILTDADTNPFDLTGASVASIARGSSKDNDGVLPLDAQITDEPGGTITLNMAGPTSEASPVGTYEWDVIVTLASGTVLPPVQTGTISLSKTRTLD